MPENKKYQPPPLLSRQEIEKFVAWLQGERDDSEWTLNEIAAHEQYPSYAAPAQQLRRDIAAMDCVIDRLQNQLKVIDRYRQPPLEVGGMRYSEVITAIREKEAQARERNKASTDRLHTCGTHCPCQTGGEPLPDFAP